MIDSNNTIISAANAPYFRSFLQFFRSYLKHEYPSGTRLIFYDIGLNEAQAEYLQELSKQFAKHVKCRVFDFQNYPEFVELKHKTYSWKPIIIHDVYSEADGNILWLDSANIIRKPLKQIWETISQSGTYVPYSGSGSLREWTVNETLEYMNVPESWNEIRNRAGNTCGFSTRFTFNTFLLNEWRKLALVKECIKPNGANRSNHRDDQSLLTILLKRLEVENGISLTNDEVDISSKSPISSISVRNFVPNYIPASLHPFMIFYFDIVRAINISLNRIKR